MITTGVILFDIPSKASKNNNILKNGLHWLRAAAEIDSEGIPQLIDIKCQAAKVEFKDKNNDPDYLALPLPEKTISKMVVADSAIKKIDQPFTSFGGRIQEESDEFYTRVSERLRHKNRAITIWDYEHIILQNFPSVYKVKCLNHTRYEGTATSINEAAPEM
ncbi:MAG: baseplate J/gp47 family protein [Draconibacterium sp.]|nr:baseplate J/gp47 family protein [Draconibacterium sp.]